MRQNSPPGVLSLQRWVRVVCGYVGLRGGGECASSSHVSQQQERDVEGERYFPKDSQTTPMLRGGPTSSCMVLFVPCPPCKLNGFTRTSGEAMVVIKFIARDTVWNRELDHEIRAKKK